MYNCINITNVIDTSRAFPMSAFATAPLIYRDQFSWGPYYLWRYILTRKMSYEASLAKLSSSLKNLIAQTQTGTGKTDADKAEVCGWIDKVAAGDVAKTDDFSVSLSTTQITHYLTRFQLAGFGAHSGPAYLHRGQLLHSG